MCLVGGSVSPALAGVLVKVKTSTADCDLLKRSGQSGPKAFTSCLMQLGLLVLFER